jgi:hypothetical protein
VNRRDKTPLVFARRCQVDWAEQILLEEGQ